MRNHPSRNTGGLALFPGTARLRLAASGIGLMAALLCAPKAHARYDICTVNGSDTTVAHVVGTFRDNMEDYDFLSDWIDISIPNAWTCTHITHGAKGLHQTNVLLKTYMHHNYRIKDKFILDGQNYGVYIPQQPPYSTRVGIIMERRYIVHAPGHQSDWYSAWLPVNSHTQDGNHPGLGYNYQLFLPDKASYTVSIESRIRLLNRPERGEKNQFPKTGNAIEFQAAEWLFWRSTSGGDPKRYLRVRTWFNHEDKTCTTPSSVKTVRMQDINRSAFGGVGTAAGTTGFNLDLIGCDQRIEDIQYKLTPVGFAQSKHPTVLETTPWPLSRHPGTLPLAAGSTATGIQLQILDENGNPVTFDRTTRLTAKNYKPGDSSATISLQAQYLQTDETITPGKVRGTMSVLYMYK